MKRQIPQEAQEEMTEYVSVQEELSKLRLEFKSLGREFFRQNQTPPLAVVTFTCGQFHWPAQVAVALHRETGQQQSPTEGFSYFKTFCFMKKKSQ